MREGNNALFAPLPYRNRSFVKTGSGNTTGKLNLFGRVCVFSFLVGFLDAFPSLIAHRDALKAHELITSYLAVYPN